MKEKQIYFTVIGNYKRLLSNLAANIVAYDSWSDEFSRKEINDLYKKLINEFEDVDFTQFTVDELKDHFDFRWFDENLLCMPAWCIDCIKDGTILTSIDGDEFEFKNNGDKASYKDTRMGVTAYGFSKSQLRDSKLETVLNDQNI